MKRRGTRTAPGIRFLLALGVVLLGCPAGEPPREGSAASASPRDAEPVPRRALCCLGAGDAAHGVLAPEERARYGVPLASGEALEVLLHQEHADLALRLLDPEGTLLLRLDSPVGRQAPEHLLFVAEESGTYTLEVEGVPPSRGGRFRLKVAGLSPADGELRTRAAAVVHLGRGHELRRQGAADEAAEGYRTAAERWHDLGEPGRQADALRWAARMLENSGRPGEAARELERAAAGFARAGRAEREALVLAELGEALRAAGRPDAALDALTRALALQRRHGLEAAEARTLTLLANLHKVRHQPAAAARRYEEALALWRRLERPRDAAVTLANLAGVYSVAGQPEPALDLLAEARTLLSPDGAEEDRAFVLEEMGLASRRLGRWERAREAYRAALEHRRRAGSPEGTVVALEGLGRLHYEAGEHEEALRRYRQALARLGEDGDPLRRAVLVQSLGWIELRRGEPRRALPLLRRALATFQRMGSAVGEAATLTGIARVERSLGHVAAAAAWAERSLEVLDEVRAATERTDLRASLLATRHGYFDVAVDCLMELHRREPGAGFARRAFVVSERGRARRLLDVLGDGTPARDRAAPPGDAGPELAALREEVNEAAEERLRLLSEGAASEALRRAEGRLRRALEELRKTAGARAADRPADSREPGPAPRFLTPGEVQARVLEPGELLLSYDLGEERSFVWAISTDRVETFTLPAAAVLEEAARRTHALLSLSHLRGSSLQVELQVARLAELVLGPVTERVSAASRLVVVAEGDLHLVPFG
ncbi:MAG: tetratricopeptide repeat protein, partial [Thermoanaerobaculia bacterium]